LNMTFKMVLACTAVEIIWDNSPNMFLSPSTNLPLKLFNAKVPVQLLISGLILTLTLVLSETRPSIYSLKETPLPHKRLTPLLYR
jgi:hypothetical protein